VAVAALVEIVFMLIVLAMRVRVRLAQDASWIGSG
jgi:hypothetical protein